MTLAEALQSFIDKGKSLHITIALVKDVDTSTRTITAKLLTSDAELPDVRLTAVVDSNGSYLCAYPKKDSSVWIAIADNSKEAIVIAVSEVEKYELIIESMKFVADKDGFVFNKGDNGGVPIVGKVKDNFDSVKTFLDTLKSAISAGFVAVGVGSAANGTTGKTAFEGAMAAAIINYADMNNDKVKH